MLSSIITISPDTCTLGGIRGFLAQAARFGLPDTALLLDGGHVALAKDPENTVMRHGLDLRAVAIFCEKTRELDDDTEVLYANDLSVDLVARSITPIGCGEHVGQTPENLLVVVHPLCVGCV